VKKNGVYTFVLVDNLGRQAVVKIPITQIEESLVQDAIIDGKKDTTEEETPKVETTDEDSPKAETPDDDKQKEKPREKETVSGESIGAEGKQEAKKVSIVSLAGIKESQIKEEEIPNNPEKIVDKLPTKRQGKSIVDNYYDIAGDFNSGNFHKKSFQEFNQEDIGNATHSTMKTVVENNAEVYYGVVGVVVFTPIAGAAVYQTAIVRRRTRFRK
jgi:hypothetical protein